MKYSPQFIHSTLLYFFLLNLPIFYTSHAANENITIENFKTGGANFVISGKKAVIAGNRVYIEKLQARISQGATETYLFSPKCDYDQINKLGKSDQRVHIRNNNMTIDGIGYEFGITSSTVTVKSDVKVKIYNYGGDLLGNMK